MFVASFWTASSSTPCFLNDGAQNSFLVFLTDHAVCGVIQNAVKNIIKHKYFAVKWQFSIVCCLMEVKYARLIIASQHILSKKGLTGIMASNSWSSVYILINSYHCGDPKILLLENI